MSKRLVYIDVAKGIGILFVVLGHNTLPALLSRFIYAFHMPLFFYLSGFLFTASSSFVDVFKKRFHSLLKPYFVTIIVFYLGQIVFGTLSIQRSFARILFSLYGSRGREFLPWVSLWFLPHLFAVSLFALIVLRARATFLRNNFLYWLFLLAMLTIGVLTISYFYPFSVTLFGRSFELLGLPFSLDLLLISSFYFLLGAETRPFLSERWLENWPLLLAAGTVFAIAVWQIPLRMDLAGRVYPYLLLSTLQALIGIWCILAISRQIELRSAPLTKLFSYLGQISIIILIFHFPIQKGWRLKMLSITDNGFLVIASGFLAGVLGSILIYELLIKNSPTIGTWFWRPAGTSKEAAKDSLTADSPGGDNPGQKAQVL